MNAMKFLQFSLKQIFLILLMLVLLRVSYSQPTVFSWNYRHGFDYISAAKDQKEQGPCGIFATVAAVEAMVQIYFNTTGSELDLSESLLYSVCGLDQQYLVAPAALGFFIDNGVVDDDALEFPDDPFHNPPFAYYRQECDYESYQKKAKIPAYGSTLSIGNNLDLKKAIMDYGPIIIMGTGADQNGDSLGLALHPGGTNVNHTVLITGWDSSDDLLWEIKDSWPGAPSSERLVEINFFEYDPHFYCIYPEYNDNGNLKYITVKNDTGVDVYSKSPAVDNDNDGFYRWGLFDYPPAGFSGCEKMDYDDSDSTIVCLNGYDPLPAPYISNTISKYVCPGGRTFTLNNFEDLSNLGFSVSWTLSPSGYFSSSPSGNTATAIVTPIASYLGKQCKIEFNLNYNSILVKTYTFEFIINGPREDLVSMSVLDSYGGSPPNSGDIYYLCPNTTYNIFYNNYDYNCHTSNFVWDLPYGWTKHWDYGHTLSINTNDYPYGLLDVKANHCCADNPVKVYSLYFAEADCGEYFMAYPNPSSEFVDIDVVKEKISSEDLVSDIKTYLSIVDKSGTARFSTTFKGFPYRVNTSDLPDGIYFMNIQFKDKRSSIRLVIKH